MDLINEFASHSHESTMHRSLLITFTSPDRPGIIEVLTSAIVAQGGNWEESRLARLCGDFAGIVRITVAAERAPALKRTLESLGLEGLHISVKETASPQPVEAPQRRFKLFCTGADHEGIVSRIASYLAKQHINVEEMDTSVEPAPTTGTPIFQMQCQLSVPTQVDLEALQSSLRDLSGELAVDIELKAE